MYGEALYKNFCINNQLYPGSVPGSTWNLLNKKLPTEKLSTVEENSDNSPIGGSKSDV